MYGPYLETFTGQQVITLSSRRVVYGDNAVVFVTSAVMLLSSVKAIVKSAVYPHDGFGAVLAYDSLQVVVWQDGVDVFDTFAQQFRVIREIDYELSKHNLRKAGTLEYVDAAGLPWIVSVVPFFESMDGASGSVKNALIMLVFARQVFV